MWRWLRYALDWSAAGIDEAAREALYRARDKAAMQRRLEALAAMMRVGLVAALRFRLR